MAQGALNKINVNQLKVFETVYRTKSMTLAAQELFLTQSGVSQHIKKLEEDLEVQLFVRNRQELFAYPEADRLYRACEKAFGELSQTLEQLQESQELELEGTIRIGVPTEFGNNVIIPKISEWSHPFAKVKFDIVYGYGSHLTDLLQANQLDLAFVDSVKWHSGLKAQPVFEESLSLAVSHEYLKKRDLMFKSSKPKIAQFMQLDYLDYEHQESILRLWFKHHFGKKNLPLKIRVWAMSVQGVASLIKQDMGAAILPDHVIEKVLKEGVSMHVFKGPKEILKNEISLVWMRKRPLPRAAEELRDFLLKESR
jgi:DNA-binding transcriptional LysR family regulator